MKKCVAHNKWTDVNEKRLHICNGQKSSWPLKNGVLTQKPQKPQKPQKTQKPQKPRKPKTETEMSEITPGRKKTHLKPKQKDLNSPKSRGKGQKYQMQQAMKQRCTLQCEKLLMWPTMLLNHTREQNKAQAECA